MSFDLKKFETEGEIEDKRRKRQEEWEKVRKPDDPVECPEKPVDNRCLYDRLEEQKQRKQDEYEEQFALKNQVKGLNEDESKFLKFVENRQQEISKERKQEERQVLDEMKDAQVVKVADIKSEDKRIKSASTTQSNKKTQSALLAGAVKRKGSEDNTPAKKSKSEAEPSCSSAPSTQDSVDPETNSVPTVEGGSPQTTQPHKPQVATVIGVLPSVLPGLNQYSDTSDSQSSSSESEGDFSIGQKNQIAIAVSEIKKQIQQQIQ